MPAEDEESPEDELARINRRGAWRGARAATATWASVLTFLIVMSAVLVPYFLFVGPLFRLRILTYVAIGVGGALASIAAYSVRRRLEPPHPEDE